MFQRLAIGLSLALVVAVGWGLAGDTASGLTVTASQAEFLALEPILVTVTLTDNQVAGLSASAGDKDGIHFDIKPAVKPRPNAKPLPQEALIATASAKKRVIDLLEWHQFPAEGKFTVQASVEAAGGRRTSAPITIVIRKPGKDDPEWGPVDRLHHMPWSNYITDAFCGDTFDVVKRWPDSKLTKYCHYWNGLHHQHKKEFDKAIESFRSAAKYPGFVLAEHARQGINECAAALGKTAAGAR